MQWHKRLCLRRSIRRTLLINDEGHLMNIRWSKLPYLAGAAVVAGCLLPTSVWAIDVASQTDWNTAVAAVAAAGAGSTVSINFISGFTMTSSLAQIQASNANVVVNITGNGQTVNGAAAFQGIQINGANAPTVNISSLAITNTTAIGGVGQNGENGFLSNGLSYGSGAGGGGGLAAGGGLLVGSGANVTLASVTFTSNTATGGAGGNGGSAQNGASSPTGGDGGDGGAANNGGATGGGGTGGSGGNTGTQGTAGTAGSTFGGGGGGGGGSGTTNSTSYTPNNSGGAGQASGGGNGGRGGDGVNDNGGSGGPGSDGADGGAGGAARGGAIYVMNGGTLTILDTPISGATATGGSGGTGGTGMGPSNAPGSAGVPAAGTGAAIFLDGVKANVGVSAGTVAYANTIGGTGLAVGGVTTALNKTGAGTLTLSATNTFSGNVNIAGGKLAIAGTANLGNAGNDVAMSDGTTLAVTGTTTFAAGRAFTIAGSSTLDIASGTNSTVQGVISDGASSGSLVKSGAGTLLLSGTNTYTGTTTVNGGTLRAGSAGALPSGSAWTVGTGAFFDLNGFSGTAGSLSGAGTVTNDGGTATTLTAGGNGADSTFSGVIQDGSGTTALTKQGIGKLTLSGINSYTGATTVNAGTLTVNGSIANSQTTVNAGRLMGTGVLGDTTIVAGTHAPGNSIGTQTVNGAYVNHGTLEIEAQPGSADQVAVNGTVNITGAKLNVIGLAGGTWNPTEDYTIILNDGADAVTGAFSTISSSLAFLDPSVDYVGGTGNDVVLTLARNNTTIASIGDTRNQRAVGAAIDQLTSGNGVYDAVIGMNSTDARRTLQLASGESYATNMRVMEENAGLFSRSLLGRTSGTGGSGMNIGLGDASSENGYVETPLMTEAAAAISGALTPAQPAASQRSLWFAPVGARGHIEGDGNAVATHWTSGGITAGYEFNEAMGRGDFLGGIAVGYLHSYAKADENLTSEQSDGGQIGFYGRWKGGPVTISGSLAGGISQSRTDRQIRVASLDLTAKSTGWSQMLGASAEVSYAIPMASEFTLSPLASLTSTFVHRNGTSENGAGAFNLDIDSNSHSQLTPGLGIELARASEVEGGIVNTHIRTVWEHVIGDTADQSLRFAGTDAAFSVKAPEAARDRLRLGLGVSYETQNRWSLFADYEGVFSSTDIQHAGRIGAKVAF